MSHVEEAFREMAGKIAESEEDLRKAERMDTSRKLQNDLKIMKEADDISVTGINATGPVHQGREYLRRSLGGGHKARILVLDPRDDIFFERAEKEGDMYGRIFRELEATVGGILDVVDVINNPDLEIGLHRHPYCAMVIGNYTIGDIDCGGDMQINIYPEGKGVRGLTGKTYQLSSDGSTEELFKLGSNYFNSLHDSCDRITVHGPDDLIEFERELAGIRTKRYGF